MLGAPSLFFYEVIKLHGAAVFASALSLFCNRVLTLDMQFLVQLSIEQFRRFVRVLLPVIKQISRACHDYLERRGPEWQRQRI